MLYYGRKVSGHSVNWANRMKYVDWCGCIGDYAWMTELSGKQSDLYRVRRLVAPNFLYTDAYSVFIGELCLLLDESV